jgi:hypothetical protein
MMPRTRNFIVDLFSLATDHAFALRTANPRKPCIKGAGASGANCGLPSCVAHARKRPQKCVKYSILLMPKERTRTFMPFRALDPEFRFHQRGRDNHVPRMRPPLAALLERK